MSTEYQPFLGVGLMFDDIQEVFDFLEYYDAIRGVDTLRDDLEDIAKKCNVQIEYLGMYNEYFVGYKLNVDFSVVQEVIDNMQKVLSRWEKKFQDHTPDFVSLVDSY